MAKVNKSFQMEIFSMEFTKMGNQMEEENTYGKMELCFKVNLLMA